MRGACLLMKTITRIQIIDEIGYILIDRQGANLFFQLARRRYERGALIVTSNQSLGASERSLAAR